MEKILVLGTGGGSTIDCYNTCHLLQNDDKYLLVDTGQGSQIIKQIRDVGININEIHDVFISHKHTDHLIGIFSVLRVICQQIGANKYTGELNIYCAQEIKGIIDRFVQDTFHGVHYEIYKKHVIFNEINDMQEINVIDYNLKILDLHSKECIQYGFQTKLNNGKILSFLGDVPCSSEIYDKIKDTDWVLHEVYCQESEKEKFKPHEKNHSTIKDVCEKMEMLGVKNLVLWHTRDNNLQERKKLYTQEAKIYYHGNVYVPDDLEVIEL